MIKPYQTRTPPIHTTQSITHYIISKVKTIVTEVIGMISSAKEISIILLFLILLLL